MEKRISGKPPTNPLPVSVLTGFLGSGKTTILSGLLRNPEMANTAVIVNEFGEAGLDHLIVEKGEEDVVLLDAGCLCCAVSDTLSDTLTDLFFRRVRGDVPPFERAIIETSGLADPAPILHALVTDQFVSSKFFLDGVIAAVDGVHGFNQLDDHEEAVKQAGFAERIIITKTDLVSLNDIAALRERMSGMNPGARILEVVKGHVEPTCILNVGLFDLDKKSVDVQRWLHQEAVGGRGHDARDPARGSSEERSEHAGSRNHKAGRHNEKIQTFSVDFDFPVTWASYADWVASMERIPSENLLRVKGLIGIAGSDRPYVIQGVRHIFSPPIRLNRWPQDIHASRLIFITYDLDRSLVEATLGALGAPEGLQGSGMLEDALKI